MILCLPLSSCICLSSDPVSCSRSTVPCSSSIDISLRVSQGYDCHELPHLIQSHIVAEEKTDNASTVIAPEFDMLFTARQTATNQSKHMSQLPMPQRFVSLPSVRSNREAASATGLRQSHRYRKRLTPAGGLASQKQQPLRETPQSATKTGSRRSREVHAPNASQTGIAESPHHHYQSHLRPRRLRLLRPAVLVLPYPVWQREKSQRHD